MAEMHLQMTGKGLLMVCALCYALGCLTGYRFYIWRKDVRVCGGA
jgi:hypothetical protein